MPNSIHRFYHVPRLNQREYQALSDEIQPLPGVFREASCLRFLLLSAIPLPLATSREMRLSIQVFHITGRRRPCYARGPRDEGSLHYHSLLVFRARQGTEWHSHVWRGVCASFAIHETTNLIGLFAFAQIAGYVVLFAPAGIGVREGEGSGGAGPGDCAMRIAGREIREADGRDVR